MVGLCVKKSPRQSSFPLWRGCFCMELFAILMLAQHLIEEKGRSTQWPLVP